MYRIIGADGREYGPIPVEQLRQWIAEGRANAQTNGLADGTTDWKPLGSFPELAHLFTPGIGTPAVFSSASIPPGRRTHPLATVGLTMGVLSMLLCCCCYGLPFNVLGLIFSGIALSQIGNRPEVYNGRSLAMIGLVLSILSILLGIAMFSIGFAMNGPEIWRELQSR